MSDSRELAHAGEQGGAVAIAQSEGERRFAQTIQMVREAMLNPDVDANKAKVMAELMTSLEDRSIAAEFNRDLNAAIMEMPVITKAGIITIPAREGKPERTQGRFARFEDIDRVVRPILNRHNLAIRFDIEESNKGISVRPILTHRNGHTERGGAMHAPIDTSGAKNNVQGAGSTVSYLKRYTMCSTLNIITEGSDDDGSLGRFSIDMPHERQVTVLEQAEEAAELGRYQDWFNGQGVKDRAWLVSGGHHARLGGEQTLLGDARDTSRGNQPAQDRGSGGGSDQQQGGQPARQRRTPEQMVEAYEGRVRDTKSLDDLRDLQSEESTVKWMTGLRDKHPQLAERVTRANTQRFRELSPPADDSGEADGLFGGEA